MSSSGSGAIRREAVMAYPKSRGGNNSAAGPPRAEEPGTAAAGAVVSSAVSAGWTGLSSAMS